MEHNLNLQFLQRLQGEDGVTELSDLKHNLGGLEFYYDTINLKTDLYFISFIPNEKWEKIKKETGCLPRTKNEFVKGINYFKADFDIRSYFYEHENGRIISDEELFEYKDKLLEVLKSDKSLGTYNAVIFSGNGIHIYWIGKTIFPDAKTYAAESTKLYDRIKGLLPYEPHLWPDYACGNIGRLLRLPGSYNCKSKYGLPPKEVKILEYKEEEDSSLVEELDSIGESLVKLDSLKIEILKSEMIKQCNTKLRGNDNSLFEKINNLDIAHLVCNYTGWDMSSDGINFVSNRDGKYTGAYVIPEENVVVHMGTPHFSDYFKVYSPFSFIMIHYADGDVKKTFEIAKEMYPELKEEQNFYFNKTWG